MTLSKDGMPESDGHPATGNDADWADGAPLICVRYTCCRHKSIGILILNAGTRVLL